MNGIKTRMKLTSFMALVMIVVLAVSTIAYASSVDAAVVDVTDFNESVSIDPGNSSQIKIDLSVSGKQDGIATFEVYKDWTLKDGTFTGSNPQEFTVEPRAAQDPIKTFTVLGKVTVASDHAAGSHTLTVSVFDITNTNATGAKLSAGHSGSFQVVVNTPPPPTNTVPSVSVTGVTDGASYQIGSVPSAGCTVTDAEDINPSATPGYTRSLDTYGLGTETVTCSYTDMGGLTASASATYTILDQTPPTISYILNPPTPDGLNNWYKSNISLTWTVTENDTPASLVKVGCADQTITADQAETTYTCSASSAGGSAGPVSVSIKRDATAPVVTVAPERVPDQSGWYNHPLAFAFTSNDGSSCEAPKTFAGPDGESVTMSGTCTDQAGNVGTGTYTFKYDATAPSITTAVAPERPVTGWWNLQSGAPTVTYSCADDVSKVATCTEPFAFGEGENLSHAGTVVDQAGNTASVTVDNIDVDLHAPTITAAIAPEKPTSGWWNSGTGAPTVTYTCGDTGPSGLTGSCPAAYAFGEGADQSHAETVYDAAGNSATVLVEDIDVDLTAPTIIRTGRTTANKYGWNNTGVTVTWSCTDGLSSAVLPEDSKTVASEGFEQTATGACADKAGNTISNTVGGINIDWTAPSILAGLDKLPASTGWYNISTGAPTVAFLCDDTGVAPSGLAVNCPAHSTFSEGANQGRSETISDRAGNTASASVNNIHVDLTAPIIADRGPITPANGANGWYTSFVINKFLATDSLSGMPGPEMTILVSSNGEGSAVKISSGTVTDVAGNSTAAIESAAFKIDLSNPTNITFVGGPAENGQYYFGFVPSAPSCAAEDAISGLASCVVTGYRTTVGSHTLTATATDNAGRTAVITRSYTVLAWTLKGFYQPVDMGVGVLNNAKGGSTVPLKFEVFAGPTELTDTAVVSTFTQKVSCASGTGDDIEQYATGGTSLRYDTLGSQFIFNWQTPKAPGSCYRVTMKTQDGSSISADFRLK